MDVVTVFHDLLYQPAIAPLLLIAQATEHVRLGPVALNPYTLHPVEIAGQVAALDLVSGGRAFLGLAYGSWLDQLGLDQPRPVETMGETVEIVRRLLAGDRSGFRGEVFELAAGAGLEYEPARPSVPLMLGTWRPRLAADPLAHQAHHRGVRATADLHLVGHLPRERREPRTPGTEHERDTGPLGLVLQA